MTALASELNGKCINIIPTQMGGAYTKIIYILWIQWCDWLLYCNKYEY